MRAGAPAPADPPVPAISPAMAARRLRSLRQVCRLPLPPAAPVGPSGRVPPARTPPPGPRPIPAPPPGPPRPGAPRRARSWRSSVAGTRAMSVTGTATVTSGVAWAASSAMMPTGWGPPRKRAISSGGRTVADRPMRCAGRGNSSSSRSSDRARWVPRFWPAKEWISSTITVSTVRSVSRTALVSIRYSDSGVVMRMSGGLVRRRRRSAGVVSPVRMPTAIGAAGTPSSAAAAVMPARGRRRLRSTSAPRALSGEMYRTRTPRPRGCWTGRRSAGMAPAGAASPGAGSSPRAICATGRERWSMADRKAARVLPEPVGAMTRAFSPRPIASQARRCTGVGPVGKAASNQARVAAAKAAGSVGGIGARIGAAADRKRALPVWGCGSCCLKPPLWMRLRMAVVGRVSESADDAA